ncbi:MAG: hypothetical protein Kow0026_16660 [Oricola sp.]
MKKRNFLKGAVVALTAAATAALPTASYALDTVKVGYMKIPPLVPMIYAQDHGLFEKNGIKVDLTVVNGGPELMTALASRSVDIGMTAVGIVLLARAKGLKLKAFGTSDPEAPDDIRNWITVKESSGIKSPKDLEGKTVGIVAKKSPAELMVRDHMLAAGADPDKVNFVALPFPQLPAALEVGNVDAFMSGEPFHTIAHNSAKMKAVDIAKGILATLDEDGMVALGGWFAGDEWLAKEENRDIAARFLKTMLEANRALAADRAQFDAILQRDFGMPPEVAAGVPMELTTDTLVADPASYAATIRALARTGMIPAEYPVEDAVEVVTYD